MSTVRGHDRLMLLSVCETWLTVVTRRKQCFSQFELSFSLRVKYQFTFQSSLFINFSLPTIDKNTGFHLRNAVQIHRRMRLCHSICVALSCHTGCHEVGLKVIVFVYTCNVCYTVLSFLLNWP